MDLQGELLVKDPVDILRFLDYGETEVRDVKPAVKPKSTIYRIKALDRALDILDCFTFENREMTLTDIVRRTGLNKTTAKRMLSNLTTRGFLRRDSDSKGYQLGLRLFELGGIVFSSFSLRESASSYMSELQQRTGETVLLATEMEDYLVYIDKRESRGVIRVSSDIGLRRHLHYGVLGMVLMAFLPPDTVRNILQKYPLESYTAHSITDQDAFMRRLREIRKQGYALEKEEAIEGVMGVAAPIRDYSRQVIAALGVVFPAYQNRRDKQLRGIVDAVREAGDTLSASLGYLI